MGDVRWTSAHQRARKRAHELFVPGTPCRYCRRPMLAGQRLHLDHVVPVAYGGGDGPTVLVHARCNMSAGATLGNRMRKSGRKPVRKYRNFRAGKRSRFLKVRLDHGG